MSSMNLESSQFSRPVLFPGYDTPHHLEALVRKKLEGPRESKPVKLRVGAGIRHHRPGTPAVSDPRRCQIIHLLQVREKADIPLSKIR